MIQTSRKTKIVLVLLGIFLGLLAVELSLRIAGAILSNRQETLNILSDQGHDITVLCIGESTTALGEETSYPSLLEEVLHQRIPKKSVKVINKGLVDVTSQKIWQEVPGHLDEYKPDIVIIMLGINDYRYARDPNSLLLKIHNFLYNSRVYKIFFFVIEDFRIRSSQDEKPQTEPELIPDPVADQITTNEDLIRSYKKIKMIFLKLSKVRSSMQTGTDIKEGKRLKETENKLIDLHATILAQLSDYYLLKSDMQKASQYLSEAYRLAPQNFGVVYAFAQFLYKNKQYKQAVEFFKKTIKVKSDEIGPYFELAKAYDALGMHEKTFTIYKEIGYSDAIKLKQWDYYCSEAGQWFVKHNYFKEAESIYQRAIENSPTKFHLYGELADIYEKLGKFELAKVQRYKATQASQRCKTNTEFTKFYYNKIVEFILKRNIKVVCMQYALRDVQQLKDMISTQYHDQVLFIANKTNFEKALEKYSYTDLFIDRFAGDFGHCTLLGHKVLAEHVVGRLIEQFSLSE